MEYRELLCLLLILSELMEPKIMDLMTGLTSFQSTPENDRIVSNVEKLSFPYVFLFLILALLIYHERSSRCSFAC